MGFYLLCFVPLSFVGCNKSCTYHNYFVYHVNFCFSLILRSKIFPYEDVDTLYNNTECLEMLTHSPARDTSYIHVYNTLTTLQAILMLL